jgi:prepilin-type N-terminal cleavage/methylation domain-containing protein/prepilin-type processing-associated H-X9-DG protein
MKKTMISDGFTLIELLVVIAIIAILAALLFPVFSAAKQAGQRAKCLSNMSQIGKAILLYTDDNDGKYPMAPQNIDTIGAGITIDCPHPWQQMTGMLVYTLRKYVKTTDIWVCPCGGRRNYGENAYTYPPGRTGGTSGDWQKPEYVMALVTWAEGPGLKRCFTNYSCFSLARHTGDHPANDIHCAQGKTPAQFHDDCRKDGYPAWLVFDSYSPPVLGYPEYHTKPFFAHKGGTNLVYWDGSAKWAVGIPDL